MNTQKIKWITTVMLSGFVALLGSSCSITNKDDSSALLALMAAQPRTTATTPPASITCGTNPTTINVGTAGTPRIAGATVATSAIKWYIINSSAAVTVDVVPISGDPDLYVGLADTNYTTLPQDYTSVTFGTETVTTLSGTGTQRCMAVKGWSAATYDLYVY